MTENIHCFIYFFFCFLGRQKLGDFFRKIDYLKVKADYKNSSDDPNNQLSDFEYKCQDSMTFDEFKVILLILLILKQLIDIYSATNHLTKNVYSLLPPLSHV